MSETALYWLYGCLAAGAGGLYLALPRASADARRLRVAGVIVGAAALAGVAMYLARWAGAEFEGQTFFVIFGVVAVLAAARVVTHPRPVYSAVYFILVVLAVTGLCILAAAEFLGAALVIIYGGAILVTYIFVIMLAQQAGQSAYDGHAREPMAAVLMGFLLAAAAVQAMAVRDPIASQARRAQRGYQYADWQPAEDATRQTADTAVAEGNVRAVGRTLMTTYVMAVEVAGVLLLVAVVGAIAVARKRIEPEAMTPEERRQAEEVVDLHRHGREAKPF